MIDVRLIAGSCRWLVATLALTRILAATDRPNILWIVSEDNGPQLGCYGDRYATTPNLDALAARGMLYRKVWSTAPVCAPARTAIISGMYPSALGAEHMRSLVRLPADMRLFPQMLREAGYYCANNSKEDYNVEKPGTVWDESSARAHWRGRRSGQPFFAVFNLELTHESQVRKRPHAAVHDPAKARVPAYQPDLPDIRQDWAQYYDQLTEMDQRAGERLAELEADGCAEDTIVFYYGDNGVGLPRSKRCCHSSGLHVPLIVRVPDRWRSLAGAEYRPGGHSDRLIGFVDLGPTVLSLAGIVAPAWMQGLPFLGPSTVRAPKYVFGLRGRMDERPDMARSVWDGRYVYIRNYQPQRPWGQHVAYMFETPSTRAWYAALGAGDLPPEQAAFWRPKAAEELYDLSSDPDEVRNLAGSREHRSLIERFRRAHREMVFRVRDVGFLPEGEVHERSRGSTPREMAQDERLYPMKAIVAMAELAASREPAALARLKHAVHTRDSAERYWAVTGILVRGPEAVASMRGALGAALSDSSAPVRIVAAEALGRYGEPPEVERALDVLLSLADVGQNDFAVSIAALDAIDQLDERARPRLTEIRKLPRTDASLHDRVAPNIGKLLDKILADLTAPPRSEASRPRGPVDTH